MSSLVVGAHVLCMFNRRLMGQTTSLEWQEASPVVRRHGVDSLAPYEISPTASYVTGTVQVLRVHGDEALVGRGIIPPQLQIPRGKYVQLLVIDRVNGKKLFQADHCMVSDQRWRVAAKGRLEGTFMFEAILSTNEIDLLS